ncbi:MAG: winged helix-turn-helix transcriptional regulator [Hyphomicrobiaceae bacterium]|nr:winged helix-turn-helix transcriptional regulator [Hyphomicrobiaceae bacterium]MCC0024747.1 winged helix-turn-helix transcriptional regulator [Hyphomicrobiaceae bacterium]
MLNQQTQLDRMFHALADANRRAMIDQLSQSSRSVSELAEPLGISLPATMQHLSILEEAGLVNTRKIGRTRSCTLDTGELSKAEQWINQRRSFWNDRLDALGEFLAASTLEDSKKDQTK